MEKAGIFYGSSTGTTEEVAKLIAKKLNISAKDVHDVTVLTPELVNRYDTLLLGTSTWGDGEMQDDWNDIIEELKTMDLSGKTIALFGCGDSQGNSDTFCGGMGELYKKLKGTGATFIGAVPAADYDFDDSSAVENDKFIGLAIDEINEGRKVTEKRVEDWTAILNNNPNSQAL